MLYLIATNIELSVIMVEEHRATKPRATNKFLFLLLSQVHEHSVLAITTGGFLVDAKRGKLEQAEVE